MLLRWTPEATTDLQQIHDYIVCDNAGSASEVANKAIH